MSKTKYYRVVEKTQRDGAIEFEVQSTDSWLDVVFGLWDVYTKKHSHVNEAIQHIETLHRYAVVKEEVVYKVKK